MTGAGNFFQDRKSKGDCLLFSFPCAILDSNIARQPFSGRDIVLELNKIFKSFGNFPVLKGASLHCKQGYALCLAGSNGAGKTTLLSIAAGICKPDSGTISLGGSVGFVPQNSFLLEDLTIKENLILWYAACGRRRRDIFQSGSIESRFGLKEFASRRIKALSGGYRKRVEIACALAKSPDYLLMDEPFTALDLDSRNEITALLGEYRQQGKGILFSSHDPAAIAGAADGIALLRDGTVVREETLSDAETRGAQIMELLMDE